MRGGGRLTARRRNVVVDGDRREKENFQRGTCNGTKLILKYGNGKDLQRGIVWRDVIELIRTRIDLDVDPINKLHIDN